MSTANDLTVRLMFQRDLPEVLAIERRKPHGARDEEAFGPVFTDPDTDAWVAETDDHIVGYIVFRRTPRGLSLLNVEVAPYWRRRGIARSMLALLHERGPARVEAVVPEGNLETQLLLRAAGYRADAVLRGHFGGEDGYLITVAVAPQ
jgi:ribosomal protein S18 acetylase RimI-like enzyme